MEFTIDLTQDETTGDWVVTVFDEIQSDIVFNLTEPNLDLLMDQVSEAINEHKNTIG